MPPVDLKARIAALQQQQAAQAAQAKQANATSQVLPKANAVAGNNALRDRIASFEKQGAVPKPKGRFGFAPPMQTDTASNKRSGELYGNRIPGLSRPHIPVPVGTKTDKRAPRSRSASRLELDRYATSPSPPASPFLLSENGDSVVDVLSDSELITPADSAGLEESQQQSLDALLASTGASEGQEEEDEVSLDAHATTEDLVQSDTLDTGADQEGGSPAIVVSPSEPVEDTSAAVPDAVAAPEPVVAPISEPKFEPPPTPPADPEIPTVVEPPPMEPTSPPPADVDPDVLAVIEQLDRATRSGDAGSVVVPAVTLQTLAALGGSPEHKNSVQDMLDQLLLEQDILDIATPIKQRFSLNGSLSQIAVRNYLAQQSELAAKEAQAAAEASAKQDTPTTSAQSSGQFLSPSLSSPDSPVAEPLSPASDIYAAYLLATPAVSTGRALPSIPEAPDSPVAIRDSRRGTFGMESTSSTAPSSPPIATPSDDGAQSITPGDSAVRIAANLDRVKSPPLSVVIPRGGTPKPAPSVNGKQARPPSPKSPNDAVIVSEPQRVISPTVTRGVLVPAPQSAASSSSSPSSTYSASLYSETSPSGGIGRKVSTRKASKNLSPTPLSAPYEEPVLTPIEGPKGFRAVVHEKVVEGKSRPVSMAMQQYPDLPSPTPLNAANMGDLAALLADAAMLERRLSDNRTPQKKLPSRPGTGSQSTSTPPPALRRGTPDRPRPTQDLPESPDDAELFGRLSQETSITARTSHYDDSRQSQYEQRPLPARPSNDRDRSRPSIDRPPSRPSDYLERIPSRPSLDRSTSARPSTDSSSSARPQLQPMFLSADPNSVRIPLPTRPKSAASSRNQTATPPIPPKSPPRTGYLSNLLSRAKSTSNLRSDPRDSVGSSSEDSVMVSTPPTPPYEMTASETGSIRSSRMFKNSISRATNFADRLLHRKDGSNQSMDVGIASGGTFATRCIFSMIIPLTCILL